MREKKKLPRLDRASYRGPAWVFWTYTTEGRGSLGLDAPRHLQFREWLCHTAARYRLACPAYCLMPDHLHIIWIGFAPDSDQILATRAFRRLTAEAIRPACWQHQPHDHVLRDFERERDAFADTVAYILQNPVRAGLVNDWKDYPFLGAMVPGYPAIDRRSPDCSTRFWRAYNELAVMAGSPVPGPTGAD